jgi:signal transduction histidine kinase
MKAENHIPLKARPANDALMLQERSPGEFAREMSHELRTPLNVIIGICQFLERDRATPLSPLHRDAVDRMERNAQALLQSVNQLLEYLRTESSNTESSN